jgi:hypothetical protein
VPSSFRVEELFRKETSIKQVTEELLMLIDNKNNGNPYSGFSALIEQISVALVRK